MSTSPNTPLLTPFPISEVEKQQLLVRRAQAVSEIELVMVPKGYLEFLIQAHSLVQAARQNIDMADTFLTYLSSQTVTPE